MHVHEFLIMLYLSQKKIHTKQLLTSSETMNANEKQMLNYTFKSSMIAQNYYFCFSLVMLQLAEHIHL